MKEITIVGIGPGISHDITLDAVEALQHCDAVVGYSLYLPFVRQYLRKDVETVCSGMKQEMARVEQAFELAENGKSVCLISSGDAGIYGMAPLAYEMKKERKSNVELRVIPGISAFQKAAALLGSPVSHDFCVISLSDLLTPWEKIERRIKAAAYSDFVTAIYNPRSVNRYWQLYRLKELFLQCREANTPVGIVRQAGREGQQVSITTLEELNPQEIDMLTILLIGNSQTYQWNNHIITPRGYYNQEEESEAKCMGQAIMMESFATIAKELKHPDIPLDRKWALLHAIHTTADFDMENIVWVDNGALEKIYHALSNGTVRTIITDVTMAASGIRKGALQRLGIEVMCYLNEPDIADYAKQHGITRSQAGIRRAVEQHPDALFVFGNAPTALMELCALIKRGKAHPCGVIAAPVGFVHVCESKHMIKPFTQIPKIIVEGRKGGSNLAATLTNAVLCWPDAMQLKPGRDV